MKTIKKHIFWILLLIFSILYVGLFLYGNACKGCFIHTPVTNIDSIKISSKRFLNENKERLTKAIEQIQTYNFKHPIRYGNYGRNGGYSLYGIYDGHIKRLNDQYHELLDFLIQDFDIYLSHIDFYSDSVLICFNSSSGILDGIIRTVSICYSESSFDELRKYRYGLTVYSQEEIPNTTRSYLWQIEDNWFVLVPKYTTEVTNYGVHYGYKWSVDNKETYFNRIYDTLQIIVDELKHANFVEDSLRIVEYKGFWHVGSYYGGVDYYLGTKTNVLDSLLADIPYRLYYEFFYTKNYIRIKFHNNDYLIYYYSDIPQDNLEHILNKKVFKLKDNWYYKDF